jgi:chromosome segregation ATPase
VPSQPHENAPSSWTYRMEVSPTGQAPTPVAPGTTDPVVLLHAMVSIQSQTLDVQRQILENQRQQLELAREAAQIARDQRSRQIAELERWQNSHEGVIDHCRDALGQLETVHSSLMADLARYVDENHENLVEGDFSLSDFVDRFGPRLAHLNTMLAVLRPLAAAQKKPETA